MHLIDGKSLAERIRIDVAKRVKALDRTPKLAVLLVGQDPASQLYVGLKEKAAQEAGIATDIRRVDRATDDALVQLIESWNASPDVDAILVQLPLPAGHDTDRVTRAIDPKKDVDGFHPDNVAALMAGEPAIISPVHEGILRLINETPLKLAGAQAVILANTDVFAAPLARLFTTAGMSTDVMKPEEIDPARLKEADVVVSALGRPGWIKNDMVRDDAVLIDVGTTKTPDGRTHGDMDAPSFEKTRAWITPVPGGVGPMTIALLLANVVKPATR